MDDRDDGAYVRVPQLDDVVRICKALNEAGARYLLSGGFAVIAHGLGRTTKDIDFLVDDSPENVARVKKGLSVLEDDAASELDDDRDQRQRRQAHEKVRALASTAVNQRRAQYEPVEIEAAQAVVGGTLAQVVGRKRRLVGSQRRYLQHPPDTGLGASTKQCGRSEGVQEFKTLRTAFTDDANAVDDGIDSFEVR